VEITSLTVRVGSTLVPAIYPEHMKLEAQIHYDGKWNDGPLAAPAAGSPSFSNGQVTLEWGSVAGAEEYDLEWTFVPEPTYRLNNDVNFRHNATRVSTRSTEYSFPYLYDNGYIVYRVRAVGSYGPCDALARWEGAWSSPNGYAPLEDVGAFSYPNISLEDPPQDEHEMTLNWRSVLKFAELGRQKAAIGYFDGTGRSRQAVAKNQTEGVAIVTETFYDRTGRPALQTLPVPAAVSEPETTIQQVIKYYHDFTLDAEDNPYDLTKSSEENPADCFATAEVMSVESGASKYYSSQPLEHAQSLREGSHAYLPDAEGLPFVQTEYMKDMSGAVRRQGGVGKALGLGSGHETKYYYTHPPQVELDRLFGSDIGYSPHYFQTLAIDPNGVATVEIRDMAQRTVAT